MRKLFLFLVLMFSYASIAQAANCICTAGCKVTAGSYPTGSGQPTSCAVYKAGVQIGTAPVVLSSTIPTSNAAVCQPADLPYNPGPAGSVACLVSIPGQPAGPVTLTVRASNAAGETADSAPYTFQSVPTLATLPSVPVSPRVSP